MEVFANFNDGYLHKVKGKLNQTGDHSILQHHAVPTETQLVAQLSVFMLDNDPKHTSKLSRKYIKSKKKLHVRQLLSWLAESAELNPIELVWNKLNRKVWAKQLTSVAHLCQFLPKSWTEVTSVYLQSLVEIMPKISNVGIATKGGLISMNQKIGKFLCFFLLFFLFNWYFMCLRNTCIQYDK